MSLPNAIDVKPRASMAAMIGDMIISVALVNYYAAGGLLILCNVFVALAQISLWHPICGCRMPLCALLPGFAASVTALNIRCI